jgi:replicative DNA helicase
MSTYELQLISKIINEGSIEEVLAYPLEENDFLTAEGRTYFRAIVGAYLSVDRAVVGLRCMHQIFPAFSLCDDPGVNVKYLCEKVKMARLNSEFKSVTMKSLEMADRDPAKAVAFMHEHLIGLQNMVTRRSVDVMFSDAIGRIVQRYEMDKAGVDTSMGEFPWETLQRVTRGIQPDDYIVFYGRPKSGKSWVLAYLASSFYMSGKRVLLYTKEMSPDNIYKRMTACVARLDYQPLRTGGLSADDEYELYTTAKMVKSMQETDMICLSGKDCPPGGDTVQWVESKAKKYKPHLIGIDGMSLMSGSTRAKSREEKITGISRDVSQMRLNLGIPVVATFHATRGASQHNRGELDEIAYSDAIGQDATLAVRVINDRRRLEEAHRSQTISLVVAGCREIPDFTGIRIKNYPAYDFSEVGVITEGEALKAKEEDKDVEELKPEQQQQQKKKKRAAAPKQQSLDKAIDEAMS